MVNNLSTDDLEAELGRQLKTVLNTLRSQVPQIADVRGLGAMVAVEFAGADGAPDAEITKRVQAEALKRKLILLSCGVNANVVRFLFPLSTPQAIFDEALGILRESMLAARA